MKGMHLGISAHRLAIARTGVARYLASLLAEWAVWPPEELPFDRITLFSPRPVEAPARYRRAIGGGRLPLALWEHGWLPWRARQLGVDLLFCPAYVIPLGYRGAGGRAVVTIHDVMQEAIPGEFPFSSRFRHAPLYRSSARRAATILTDSEASRRDIERYYGGPPGRIAVVPLAADPSFHPRPDDDLADLRARYGLGEAPVILFVGKFSRRRNLPALIEAFARLAHDGCPHLLVLVGVNHLGLPVDELARRAGVGERVVYARFVPDEDLRRLYALADLFVYPSEMEGFGLPVLEAMASGTPAVTLRRPVFEEVAGDAACYAESGTPEALHAAMAGVVTDRARHAELRRKGLERARAFSWTTTARRTMDVLRLTSDE